MSCITNTFEVEWCKPQLSLIFKEIKESNGNVKEISNSVNLVKIMSRISNYIRYDIISKNETITYKIAEDINEDIINLFM
jgi:hypothetical protein